MFVLNDVETNLVDYIKLADGGSVEHQEKLGIYYWLNFDLDNAEKYLELAANGGSVSAMVMLAEIYVNPPASHLDQIDAMRDAFVNDEFENFDFDDGFNTEEFEKKKEKANSWIEKAAKNGDHYSMHDLAVRYRALPKDKKSAFEWCLKSAELGNVFAQNDIGAHYEHGKGIGINNKLAFEWYMKAAIQGEPTAMYNVGQCYRIGRGVKENQEKAFEWYMKAAQKGNGCAQNEVAIYYDEGLVVSQNRYEAYNWFRRGAISGNKTAKYSLGNCYHKGIGTKVDYEKAFIIFYELATLPEPYTLAFNKLAIFFFEGLGVKENKKQAILWLKKGANSNEPYSMLNLAECYENGDGVKKDLEKAEKLRKKAERILNEEN